MSRADSLLWRRWAEVDALLDAALDHPPEQRLAYVLRTTDDDPSLRELLVRLLDRVAEDAGALTRPPPEVVAAAFGEAEREAGDADLEPGTMVGRYVVGNRRGRGGMATVYEAERSDGAYRQRVALKVLRRGLDTDDLVRRFLTERQILSSLAHPNIARLLDGGSTLDGRPYLVMELVDGEPITAHADSAGLSVEKRLELALGVAEAVSAAHRRLVVHRDIKPSNILVDREGRVRLLDFGIAKLLAGEGEATDVGTRVLTPDYASPEQLRSEAITTASDVYQLGLLLWELLTGLPPHAGGRRPGEPLRRPSRAALESPAGWPSPTDRAASRGTTPARLARALAGELDIIVGKALRPEAARRYASADALAADVRCYLTGRPIKAYPESPGYRLRKFLVRHPAVLPGSVATVLALVTFIGVLTVQNRRLQRQRDVAATSLRQAQETQGFFVDLFRSPDPWAPADPDRGRDITVVDALQLGAARVQDELTDQPLVRAALLSTIGGVLLSLDQPHEARGLLQEAVSLRERHGSGTEELSDDLGRLGQSLHGINQHDSARMVLARRLDLERQRVLPDSARLSRALRDLAVVHFSTGPLEYAVALLEEATDVLRAAEPLTRAAALVQLSDGYRKVDRLSDSEVAAREALRLAELGAGREDAWTASAAYTLAKTLGMVGRFDEAGALFSRSLAVLTERLGSDHAYTIDVRSDFGFLLVRSGDYRQAEAVFRELLDINRRKHGGDRHTSVATSLQNLAGALLGQRRYVAAEHLTRQAEVIFRQVTPPGSYVIAYPMLTRSEIQLARRDYGAAVLTADSAAQILRGRVPQTHPAAVVADCRLGQAQAGLGRMSEARALLTSVGERLQSSEGLREVHRDECRAALSAIEAGGSGSS
jgi:serine/threonine-protein kinase